ncbi:MAG: septal ring lytic transglycosylase RlpA family protein, partial [Gammaproteobacteria bacterium]
FHGRKTSNGERFDMYQVSAAHKTLPIPTVVRVTNLENSKKIDVRINDRGPFHDDRLIDLSMAAARALGFSEQGTAPVVVEAIDAVNYPEQFVVDDTPASVYLQAGAFQSVAAAEALVNKIEAALPETLAEVGLRELPSEQTGGVLHKVWIGPLTSPERASEVTELLAGLGVKKPMRVQVD